MDACRLGAHAARWVEKKAGLLRTPLVQAPGYCAAWSSSYGVVPLMDHRRCRRATTAQQCTDWPESSMCGGRTHAGRSPAGDI
jgi:hypothetical protein